MLFLEVTHTFSSLLSICFGDRPLIYSPYRALESDAKLSVDEELLTTVYRLNGRFLGLFRCTFEPCGCCLPHALLLLVEQIESLGRKSVEFVFVGDGTATEISLTTIIRDELFLGIS